MLKGWDMAYYKTFDDLLKNNKGLFKLFWKSQNNGLLKAIWEARQGEIDILKDQIKFLKDKGSLQEAEIGEKNTMMNLMSKKIESEKANFEAALESHKAEVNALNVRRESLLYQLSYDEKEIEARDLKISLLESELEKMKSYASVMEKTLAMKDAEDQKQHSDQYALEENLTISHETLIELNNQREALASQVSRLESELSELKSQYKESQAVTRQFKELNFKMSNELYKLNHEVERLNGF